MPWCRKERDPSLQEGDVCIYALTPYSTSNASLNVPEPQQCFSQHKQAATEGPLGRNYSSVCFYFLSLAEISAENSYLNNTTLNPPVLSIKVQAGRYRKLGEVAEALAEKNICTRKWAVITVALRLFSVYAHLFCMFPPRSSCTHKCIITPTARRDDFCFHQLSEMTWITHHHLTQMQPSDMLITAYITTQPSFQDLNCGHTVLREPGSPLNNTCHWWNEEKVGGDE